MPNGMRIAGRSHLPQLVTVDRPKVFYILHLKIWYICVLFGTRTSDICSHCSTLND
jgi:hypothetical protein